VFRLAKKTTQAHARRQIEVIHQKVNSLMMNNHITTAQFMAFLKVVEQSRNRLKK
jgi:hypothetical protein